MRLAALSCAAAMAWAVGAASGDVAVPVVVWSELDLGQEEPAGYFGLGGVAQVEVAQKVHAATTAVGAKAAVVFMADAVSPHTLSEAVDAYDEVPGAKAAAGSLARAVANAKSSLVMPFVFDTAKKGVQSAWSRFISEEGGSQRIILQASEVKDNLHEQLQKRLETGPARVLVRVSDDPEEWNSAVDETLKVLKEVVGDQFVAVFTGVKKPQPEFPQSLKIVDIRRQLSSHGFELSPDAVRATPNTLFGLLLALALVLATALYLCCMDNIQTPTKIATRYPALGKVYD